MAASWGAVHSSPHMPVEATDQLWWVCAKDMIADELTQAMCWDSVRELVQFCKFSLSVKPIRAGFGIRRRLSRVEYDGCENQSHSAVPT